MTRASRCILVVEDDEPFRELLVEHLRAAGHRVRAVSNGADALQEIAAGDGAIGLVLLDLRMPVMDGFELCRRIDGLPGRQFPVVVVTAEHEMREVAGSECVVAVLHKPLDLRRLEALVHAHLRQ